MTVLPLRHRAGDIKKTPVIPGFPCMASLDTLRARRLRIFVITTAVELG